MVANSGNRCDDQQLQSAPPPPSQPPQPSHLSASQAPESAAHQVV
jgi:hypothetical protein